MLDILADPKLVLGITTPIALIAFFISAYYGFKYRKSKNDIEKLKTIPENERSELLKSLEADYPSLIELNNLTREQRYLLALEQIKNKERERQRRFYLTLIIALFAFGAVMLYAFTSKASHIVVNDPKSIENLKQIYPKLEQLIAVYSLIAWRSQEQKELKISEDNNIDGSGRSFKLECSQFTWDPYVSPKPGQLFDCFSETRKAIDEYSGQEFEASKLTSNYEYWYDFKWESLFGYEIDVRINPDYSGHKNLYELKDRLSVDSSCLTELGNDDHASRTCSFNIYVVDMGNLSASKEIAFLVSDGYLHWNSNGSVDRIDEWGVFFGNTSFITVSSLRKFIQQLLHRLNFAETDLAKAIPEVEAKWYNSNPSIVADLLKDAEKDKELKKIMDFVK